MLSSLLPLLLLCLEFGGWQRFTNTTHQLFVHFIKDVADSVPGRCFGPGSFGSHLKRGVGRRCLTSGDTLIRSATLAATACFYFLRIHTLASHLMTFALDFLPFSSIVAGEVNHNNLCAFLSTRACLAASGRQLTCSSRYVEERCIDSDWLLLPRGRCSRKHGLFLLLLRFHVFVFDLNKSILWVKLLFNEFRIEVILHLFCLEFLKVPT